MSLFYVDADAHDELMSPTSPASPRMSPLGSSIWASPDRSPSLPMSPIKDSDASPAGSTDDANADANKDSSTSGSDSSSDSGSSSSSGSESSSSNESAAPAAPRPVRAVRGMHRPEVKTDGLNMCLVLKVHLKISSFQTAAAAKAAADTLAGAFAEHGDIKRLRREAAKVGKAALHATEMAKLRPTPAKRAVAGVLCRSVGAPRLRAVLQHAGQSPDGNKALIAMQLVARFWRNHAFRTRPAAFIAAQAPAFRHA